MISYLHIYDIIAVDLIQQNFEKFDASYPPKFRSTKIREGPKLINVPYQISVPGGKLGENK